MKVKIEYKYDKGFVNPYIAYTYIDGDYIGKLSDKSFEHAKERLIEHLKQTKLNAEIPKPEEVEI